MASEENAAEDVEREYQHSKEYKAKLFVKALCYQCGSLAQLVATLVESTKLLYAGPS